MRYFILLGNLIHKSPFKQSNIFKLIYIVIGLILCFPIPSFGQAIDPPPIHSQTQQIKAIQFNGSEVHPPENLWQGLIGLPINDQFLTKANEIREQINQWYWDNNYITTFTRIPVQDLSKGILTIEIIPGTVEKIEIEGLRRLNPDYINSRLNKATQPLLNTQRLIDALQILQESGLFSSFTTELAKGSSPSLSILKIKITESPTQEISLEANTFEAKAIGSDQLVLAYENINLVGLGDRFFVQGNLTSGKQQVYGEYQIPITDEDTTLRLRGQYGNSRIITPPIDQFDLTSESTEFAIDLRHPIINTPKETLGLTLTYDNTLNKTRLLGFPFGFDPRYPNGVIPFSIFRLGQDYRLRGENSIFFLASNLSYGSTPESFFSWQFQVQYAHILAPSLLISVFRITGQLSGDDLFPEEKYKIGGAYSVRGYQYQCCQGDNGISLSGELRIIPLHSDNWRLELTPFIDFGTVWNNLNIFNLTLASHGLQVGIIGNNLELIGYCADPLSKQPEIEQSCAALVKLKLLF